MVAGRLIKSFALPSTGASGLTYDGRRLWLSDPVPDLIYQLSPVDGKILGSFDAPGGATRGLSWDPVLGHLWAVDTATQLIFQQCLLQLC